MIEGIALVRFDQGTRCGGVGNVANTRISIFQETIETFLLRRMQSASCYQRHTSGAQWLFELRAGDGIDGITRKRIGLHEEPVLEDYFSISCHLCFSHL